jgi:hypothetical protein
MQFTTTAEDMHAAAMDIQDTPERELAIVNAKIKAMQDLIDSMNDSFELINIYWSQDETESEMRDACWNAVSISEKALEKIKPFLS